MAKKQNPTRRLLMGIGILVCVLLLVGVIGSQTGLFGGRDRAVAVETSTAEVRSITQVVTASGKVQPEVEVKISPDVSGEIIELRVREGDQIRQGDLLVRIRPDFYLAQEEQAQAGVLQAQAAQAQRKADLLKAELDFQRQQELYDKNVISKSDFQVAQTQYEVARASFEAAEYAVQSAQARLREVHEQVSKTRIYAPMTGTISKLNVELGERVVGTSQMAGTEMMRIAKLDQMELEVDVNENDVVNVSAGDSAAVEVDAYPERTLRGIVTEIANSARVSGAGSQEEVTNFPVKIRIRDAHNVGANLTGQGEGIAQDESPQARVERLLLRPGMSGIVDIFTQTVPGAVVVPIQAVTVRDFNQAEAEQEPVTGREDDGADETAAPVREDLRKVVFLVEDGTARMVEVETGIADDTHLEITSGLSGGETVITGPYRAVSRTLEPGMKVTLDRRQDGRAALAATPSAD